MVNIMLGRAVLVVRRLVHFDIFRNFQIRQRRQLQQLLQAAGCHLQACTHKFTAVRQAAFVLQASAYCWSHMKPGKCMEDSRHLQRDALLTVMHPPANRAAPFAPGWSAAVLLLPDWTGPHLWRREQPRWYTAKRRECTKSSALLQVRHAARLAQLVFTAAPNIAVFLPRWRTRDRSGVRSRGRDASRLATSPPRPAYLPLCPCQ